MLADAEPYFVGPVFAFFAVKSSEKHVTAKNAKKIREGRKENLCSLS
jgi:hypothetical protein